MTKKHDQSVNLTDKDCIRIQFILGYLLAESHISTADLYKKTGLGNEEVTALRRSIGYKDANKFVPIFNYLYDFMSAKKTWEIFPDLRENIKVLFEGRRPIEMSDPSEIGEAYLAKIERRLVRIFLKEAMQSEPGDKGYLSNFAGNYRVIRYATRDDEHPGPRVIVAAASIEVRRGSSPFPRCTLYFPDREKVPVEDLPMTRGMLIPFNNHVFMIGQDKDADYPAIIVFQRRGVKVHEISGLVLRRHINGLMISARCRFIRHEPSEARPTEDHRTFEQLLEEVAIYDEQHRFVQDNLLDFLRHIENAIKPDSKGTLTLRV